MSALPRRMMISILLLLGTGAAAQQRRGRNDTVQARAQGYTQCKTARERLLFCIAAIDDAVIDLQADVDEIKGIFGEDFKDLGPDGADAVDHSAVVSFERLRPLPAPDASDPLRSITPARMSRGWYLLIKYDKRRRVRDYWLSDTHKGIPKRAH